MKPIMIMEEKHMATKLNDKYLKDFISDEEYTGVAAEVKAAHKALHDGSGLGNDFIGWLDLPTNYDKDEFARIKAAAEKIKKDTLPHRTTTLPARIPRRSSLRATPSAHRLLPR